MPGVWPSLLPGMRGGTRGQADLRRMPRKAHLSREKIRETLQFNCSVAHECSVPWVAARLVCFFRDWENAAVHPGQISCGHALAASDP